jgi:hypothetical protein
LGVNFDILKCKSGICLIWQCYDHTTCSLHTWEQTPASRTGQLSGCPFCCVPAQKVCKCMSVGTMYPELLLQFNPELNLGVDLFKVSHGSSVEVTWLCNETVCGHHIWKTQIQTRCGQKSRCPFCYGSRTCECKSVAFLYPHLVNELDDPEGKIDLSLISWGSKIKLPWFCSNPDVKCDHHKWTAGPWNRTQQDGDCPFCTKHRVCPCNSFGAKFPHLLLEIDEEYWPNWREEYMKYGAGADLPVHWVCRQHTSCDKHKWVAAINTRAKEDKGTNCPYCCVPVHAVCKCLSVGTLHPELVSRDIHRV